MADPKSDFLILQIITAPNGWMVNMPVQQGGSTLGDLGLQRKMIDNYVQVAMWALVEERLPRGDVRRFIVPLAGDGRFLDMNPPIYNPGRRRDDPQP